jgi:peptidoglycan/xylan/chitin deacetylase (PgdA/CDA1 family)
MNDDTSGTTRRQHLRPIAALVYHHVGPATAGTYRGLSVSPELFLAHMKWLREHEYQPITATDYLNLRRSRVESSKQAILITFDDAYADITRYALPVLRKFGFLATVFVPTSHISGANSWDTAHGWSRLGIISRREICAWAGMGVEFGSHSHRHIDLRRLSRDQLKEELGKSRDDLENILGAPVVAMSYPYGRYNRVVLQEVDQAFQLGFTVEPGMNIDGTDLRRLRRTLVSTASVSDLAMRVRHGWTVRQLAGRISRKILGRQ